VSAPEWDQGYGLSWSGKWHAIARDRKRIRPSGYVEQWSEAVCGSVVERNGELPQHLEAIKNGEKSAPICKKCAKAKAAQ
jgi:hypothetical protein